MGDNEGDWIKLYRKITDSKVWYYTHGQYRVWTTILLSVNWGETWGRFDGEEIKVKPGEMITSIEHLSDESMTSKNIVRKTLDKLEKDDMIETDRTNKGTHLKVLNWSKYQQNGEGGHTQDDPQADTQDDPQAGTQGEDTIRKKKEGEELEEETQSACDTDIELTDLVSYWNSKDDLTQTPLMPKPDIFDEVDWLMSKEGWGEDDFREAIDNYETLKEEERIGINGSWDLYDLVKHKDGRTIYKIKNDPDNFSKDREAVKDSGSSGSGPDTSEPGMFDFEYYD